MCVKKRSFDIIILNIRVIALIIFPAFRCLVQLTVKGIYGQRQINSLQRID